MWFLLQLIYWLPRSSRWVQQWTKKNMYFAFWMLEFGFCMWQFFFCKFWILDFWIWFLNLDFGFWVLDFGFWMAQVLTGFWTLHFAMCAPLFPFVPHMADHFSFHFVNFSPTCIFFMHVYVWFFQSQIDGQGRMVLPCVVLFSHMCLWVSHIFAEPDSLPTLFRCLWLSICSSLSFMQSLWFDFTCLGCIFAYFLMG